MTVGFTRSIVIALPKDVILPAISSIFKVPDASVPDEPTVKVIKALLL